MPPIASTCPPKIELWENREERGKRRRVRRWKEGREVGGRGREREEEDEERR